MTEDANYETQLNLLHGDFVQAVIDELKHAQEPWQKLSESAQSEVIQRVKDRTEKLIRGCVSLAASEGFDSCDAMVNKVTFAASGPQATISMLDTDGGHRLADRVNEGVVIQFVDTEKFLHEESDSMPQAEPDQGDLVN